MGTEGLQKTADPRVPELKAREFMTLLPLTMAIAGLPNVEPGRHLNEGQMDVRANTLKTAYKFARQLIQDIASK